MSNPEKTAKTEARYEIIRFHRDDNHPDNRKVVATGLTHAEAQAYCRRDDTHEKDSEGLTIWFDGYGEE